MISEDISLYASYGAKLILIFLFMASILVVAFFIERILFFSKNLLRDGESLFRELDAAGSKERAVAVLRTRKCEETAILLRGLEEEIDDNEGFRNAVLGHFAIRKGRWERFLSFFASVGSNAPFAGLLGTVLGLMKSFSDLALASHPEPKVAMEGISDALITTVVGLCIAIPSIIFFNICKGRIKKSGAIIESMTHIILSREFVKKGTPRRMPP